MRPIVMKGNLVSLAPVEREDARRIYELYADPDVRRFLDSNSWWVLPNEKREEEFVESILKGRDLTFAVIENKSGDLIGLTSLMKLDTRNGKAEIGYWIGKPYWGRGYGKETAYLTVKYGFERVGLRKIYAHVYEANARSKKILEDLGFRLVGRLRKHMIDPELGSIDLLVYDILREEWGVK